MNETRLTECLLRYRRAGDPDAVAEAFDLAAPRLWPLALRLGRSAADADDLLQSTFVAAIEAVERFDSRRPAMGWLVGILNNQARDQRRRAARRPDPARLESPAEAPPEDAIVSHETRGVLRGAIERLPQRYREVFELVLEKELAPSEIAAHLDRSPMAVRTQLHRGLAMLRERLPRGFALPALWVGLGSPSLEAVRAAVRKHAAERAGGLARTAARECSRVAPRWMAASGLVASTGLVAVLALRFASSEGGEAAGDSAPRSEFIVSIASEAPEEGEPLQDGPRVSERTALPQAPASVVVPESLPDPLEHLSAPFDLWVGDDEGVALSRGAIVAPEEADFVLHDGKPSVPGGGEAGLVNPGYSARGVGLSTSSGDAWWRAVLRVDPDLPQWNRTLSIRSDLPYTSVFVVRTRSKGWALVGRIAFLYSPERRRHESLLRCLYNPDAPVFRPGSGAAILASGFVLDPEAFRTDPERAALEARWAAALDPLDEAVRAALRRALPLLDEEPRVRGVLCDRHASTIDADRWARVASTFSFVHDTRDDDDRVQDDWDLYVQRAGMLAVTTVVDDRSRAWNLGLVPGIPAPEALDEGTDRFRGVTAGSHFLIHTLDPDTDRWDLVQVLELEDRWMVFQWAPFEDEAWLAARAEHLAQMRLPIRPRTVVQMRNGAGGGNEQRFFLDGSVERVEEIATLPVYSSTPVDANESSRAWTDLGVIPRGSVWRIWAIEYEASTAGDTNGPGGFRLVVADRELVAIETEPERRAGRLQVELVLRPEDLQQSFLEIRNSSQCEVVFLGSLEPEAAKPR